MSPWEKTSDPDGVFALFDAAIDVDIANANAVKSKFPEIAVLLDDYIASLRIRRELVAEGRDRNGERNNALQQAIHDFEVLNDKGEVHMTVTDVFVADVKRVATAA